MIKHYIKLNRSAEHVSMYNNDLLSIISFKSLLIIKCYWSTHMQDIKQLIHLIWLYKQYAFKQVNIRIELNICKIYI